MKKLICVILACAMVVSLLASCGNDADRTPQVNQAQVGTDQAPADTQEPGGGNTQFTIFAGISAMSPDNSEKMLVQQMIENIPVSIEWICVSGDALTERKNLILAAGTDLPCAFMGAEISDFEQVTYGSRGIFIPLQDYFTPEIMPNLMNILEARPEVYASLYMPDGNIYGLPTIGEMGFEHDGRQYEIGSVRHMNFINKAWLDELGLDIPTTIGELTTVLRAFQAKDPNIIPLGFNNQNNFCGNLKQYYTAFGFTDFHWDSRNYKDGVVSFGALDPRLKDVVNTFHMWSNEGLLDIEGFTQDDSMYIAKGQQGLYGVLTWWELPEITGDFADQYVFLPPLKGDDGTFAFDIAETGTSGRGDFSITSYCENPELLLRWIDQLYIPINSMQKVYGPIGEFYRTEPDEHGMWRMRDLLPGESEGELKSRLELFGPSAQLSDYYTEFWELEPRAQDRLDYIRDFYLPFITNHTSFPATVAFTEEEIITLGKVVDINDFRDETFARWVRHGGADEEWDDYVRQLERLGVHEVVAAWQAAADRFNAAMR